MYKKISKRELEFRNFRNIGVGSDSEKLLLNTNWDSDNDKYQGNLLILIGPNNSGKSNILDALKIFSKKNLSERDKTNLNFDKEFQNPILKLISKNNNLYEVIKLENNNYIFSSNDEESKLNNVLDMIEKTLQENTNIPRYEIIKSIVNEKEKIKNINDLREKIQNNNSSSWATVNLNIFIDFLNNYINSNNKNILWLKHKLLNQVQDTKIVVHEYINDNLIKSKDLSVYINSINQSNFFKNLFEIIEYDIDTLLTTYKQYNLQKIEVY